MNSGSVKRSAPETPLMDEGPHPFRIAKPRVEAEAPEGENATWQQHVRHLELHVDSLNTFATALIEQTLPQVKNMFERMAVIENNFQNVGQNTEQLVATSVRDHHQEMKEHLARVEGSVPDMQRRVEEVMTGAAERIEQKLRELVSDDQRIEQALKHVAGCTEQEVEKIKAATEQELQRVKVVVEEQFETVKSGVETFASQTDCNGRMSQLEVASTLIHDQMAEAKKLIADNFLSHESVIQTVHNRVDSVETALQGGCHCKCVDVLSNRVDAIAVETENMKRNIHGPAMSPAARWPS